MLPPYRPFFLFIFQHGHSLFGSKPLVTTVTSYSPGQQGSGDTLSHVDIPCRPGDKPATTRLQTMPCKIVDQEDECITVKISGLLTKAELSRAERAASTVMRTQAKIRLLLLVENFDGWDNRDDWGDLSFQSQYDRGIEKIALVCEKQWQEKAEAFVGKGIRAVDIRSFNPSQRALAEAWLK